MMGVKFSNERLQEDVSALASLIKALATPLVVDAKNAADLLDAVEEIAQRHRTQLREQLGGDIPF
jgi:hypothetical protein